MQNDQNRRPGFLESAMGHGTFVVVAIIAVVFVSMVLHLLWNGRRDRKRALRTLIRCAMALGWTDRDPTAGVKGYRSKEIQPTTDRQDCTR